MLITFPSVSRAGTPVALGTDGLLVQTPERAWGASSTLPASLGEAHTHAQLSHVHARVVGARSGKAPETHGLRG
jgi:hypothetical protein